MNSLDVFVLPSISGGSRTRRSSHGVGPAGHRDTRRRQSGIVLDGETGLLCGRSTPDSLADAMEHYRRNPDVARQHGAAGRARRRAVQPDSMMRSYVRLYDEVLAGRPSRAVDPHGMDVKT
jgi:hypothetical protein